MKKAIITIAAFATVSLLSGCASLQESCESQNARLRATNDRLVEYKKEVDTYVADYHNIPGWMYSELGPKQLQAAYVQNYNMSYDNLVREAKAHNERCVWKKGA